MGRDGDPQNKTTFVGRPMTREGREAMESAAPAALCCGSVFKKHLPACRKNGERKLSLSRRSLVGRG